MVPEGWTSTTLIEVMEFKNGLNFTKSDQGEAIKIVGVSNFKNHTELPSTNDLDIIKVSQSLRPQELLEDGDLLFVRSNGNKDLIGRCLFFPKVKERIAFSGFTIRGRVKSSQILPEYLADIARSPVMKQQISRNGGGTNISNLSQQILGDVVIPLPPLPEQKKIFQILSTWDQAITATERLLENSQQRKKGLMQQLLTGKKRLPGFEGEWEQLRLKELLSEEKARNKDLTVTRVLSVTNHSGFVLPEDQFSKRVASDNVSNYRVVSKGQYGYNPSRLNVGSFARLDTYDKGILSPMYVVFSVNEAKLNNDYFLNWMKSNEAKQRIARSTQGSVRDSVGFDALCSFPFRLPPLNEQERIAEILISADREIENISLKVDLLKQEKKALMQQLLTGKRRVKVDVDAA